MRLAYCGGGGTCPGNCPGNCAGAGVGCVFLRRRLRKPVFRGHRMAWPSCSHASWNIASLSCTQSAYSPPYMASAQKWQRLSWVFYAGRNFGRAGLGSNPALAPHLPGDRVPAHPTLPSRHLSERQAASRRSGRPPAACSGWPPAAHNPKWCTIIRVLNSETRSSVTSYQ